MGLKHQLDQPMKEPLRYRIETLACQCIIGFGLGFIGYFAIVCLWALAGEVWR